MNTNSLNHDIDTLLAEIRERRIILQDRGKTVSIWAPNKVVSRATRASIAQHRQELLHMLARSDIRVCPTPDMHRKYYTWSVGRYVCDACAHLAQHLEVG